VKPASAKQKGRSFQQEVRDLILNRFDTLEPDDVKSTSMGAGGEDVQLSPAARKLLPIQIECKRVKSAKGLYNWYNQAKAHGKHEPVVFTRADRETPLVLLSATTYLDLMKELSELRKKV
jgi:hypothetical protein